MSGLARRDVPSYDELPELGTLGVRHSWGVFGDADEMGTLNFLEPSIVLSALADARTGESISLTLDPDVLDPPLYGRNAIRHNYLAVDRNNWDDRLDDFYPQGASQWDGLRHVRAREFGFYGGVTADPPAMGNRLGIDHWARRGIIGRGVLLDVEAYCLAEGKSYDSHSATSIMPELLAETADYQRVSVGRGDLLCVRTGWTSRYRELDADKRHAYAATPLPVFAGLFAGESSARYLWNLQVAAVAADNPALEVSPGDLAIGSLHRRLIPALGMVVGELFDFDALALRCVAEERYSFLFVSVPLNIRGGVGSPANAVAIW